MANTRLIFYALYATSILKIGFGAPTPQDGSVKSINNDDVPGIPVGPPGATGSIYGSANFLGNDGNPLDPSDSAVVTNYELVPGQEADANIGLYLDFNDTPNPQPLRGLNGATDPGPRKRFLHLTRSNHLLETLTRHSQL